MTGRDMKTLILCLLAAAAAAAEPSLTERLASDDPAVRAAALREIDALPADHADRIEKLAGDTDDPEVKTSLIAACRRLREKPLREKFEPLAQEVIAEPGAAWKRILAEGDGAAGMLVLWLDREDAIVNSFRGDGCLFDNTEIALGQAAAVWLRFLTAHDFGRDVDAWREFFAARPGKRLSDIALEGLAARGYRVTDADAGVAAAALLSAWSAERLRRNPVPSDGFRGDALVESVEWIVTERVFGRRISPYHIGAFFDEDEFREWLAANRGHVARENDRFVPTAAPEHYLELAEGGDPVARRGALRELLRFPKEAAARVRKLIGSEPGRVLRIMAAAGEGLKSEELPAALDALRWGWDEPENAALWDPEVLAAWLRGAEDELLIVTALRALSVRGEPGHAAVARGFLDREPAIALAAWLAVAKLGTDGEAGAAVKWLDRARDGAEYRPLAIALARRGHREGLAAVRDITDRGWLRDGEIGELRGFVEGLPGPGEYRKWRVWVEQGIEGYEWDDSAKKWRR